MKPFAVVSYNERAVSDLRIPNYNGAARHAWWPLQKEAMDGADVGPDTLVFYCDTLESADALARACAEKNPGRSYGVMSCSNVYITKPGPISATRWTDKGLLPL